MSNLAALANVLYCKIGSMPMTYLGSHFGEEGMEIVVLEKTLFV